MNNLAKLPRWATAAAVSTGLAALGAAYVYFVEPQWLSVSDLDVEIPDLPLAFDGLLIAHLSDLHVTRDMGARSPVGQAIQICQARQPDLVLMTGDFVGKRNAVGKFAELIAGLHGMPVYGVLGNHEHQHGPSHRQRVTAALREAGVELLLNRATCIERNGSRLWIVGVDDAYTGLDQLDCALDGLGPLDRPRILLSHYPDLMHHPRASEVDLALAGHTHGGQINLPILNASTLAHADSAYLGGMFRVNGVPLYVSRGLGTSGYRVRFRARPELVFLTLRRSPRC